MASTTVIHVGSAAGFSGDRTDAASAVVDALIRIGGPACLIFETLAERTLALAQLARLQDPEGGYEPLLDDLIRPILERCLAHRIPIVSNFGAANPRGAGLRIQAIARELGLRAPRVAVVHGDDVAQQLAGTLMTPALRSQLAGRAIISANAYIGAQAIADALRAGADVVVTGRVADPSLVLGPALAHHGWPMDDWDRIAGATMAGHLLECGAQVTGGYYADPGVKDVPDLARVGYPIAAIEHDGSCTVFKPDDTGGVVDEHTVKEQLLYEVHDPAAYLTPDVVADITQARVGQVGPGRVRLSGVRGHGRPDALKVNVCFETGWLAEGEISSAGARAEHRARLAADILTQRLQGIGPLRIDLIGVASVLADDRGRWLHNTPAGSATDVRLRGGTRQADKGRATRLMREVNALYTCGPAGGGGVRTALRPTLGTISCPLDREHAPTGFDLLEDTAP